MNRYKEYRMKLLLMAASLRKGSFNKKLIDLACVLLREQKIEVDKADFSEFDMPLYDGDVNEKEGLPKGALAFMERMDATDGIIISSPEYNFSTPGTLKNLIDWISRGKPMPWTKKTLLLMSASPSLVGGNRGLWHTRVPLEACGAIVYPDMFSLASANTAFQEDGSLKDDDLQKRLKISLIEFVKFLEKLKH